MKIIGRLCPPVLVALSVFWNNCGAADRVRNVEVPTEFFGLVIHRAHTTTTWPDIPFGSWRLWDSYLKWSDIQPRQGDFDFSAFDKQVQLGIQHRKEMTYTFGQTPRWASKEPDTKHAWGIGSGAMPRSISDFQVYVEAVVRRFKGKIYGYEVWNEPKYADSFGNCSGSIFFCGSAEDLVALTRIAHSAIQRFDPQAKLATPGFTDGIRGVERLDKYLAAGGASLVQAISFHFYDIDPESIWDTTERLRRVMAKHGLSNLPIWNSEFGFMVQDQNGSLQPGYPVGPFSRVFEPHAAAARIARAQLVAASAGIDRFTFYAWDDKRMGAVGSNDGRPHQVAKALATMHAWLRGAVLSCSDGGEVSAFTCTIKRNGRSASIYWERELLDGNVRMKLRRARAAFVERLDGQGRNLAADESIEWDGAPTLVANDGLPWSER